jgi:NitT/TauT family transport system substrate-binding protein
VRRGLAVCATAVTLLAGCAEKQSHELETVRITARRHLSGAPVYIADEEGYFAEEGIRLEFVDAPSRSMQAIPLLEQGRIDVLGSAVSSGLFSAVRSGARLKIVADRGHVGGNCEFNGVIGAGATFPTDSPTAAQVRGRTFSINATTTPEFITDRFLASRGLVTKDIKVVSLSETVEPQALRSGALHATHVTEPYIASLRKDGHRLLGSAREYAPGAHFGVIVFGPTLTVRNRALGQRFMNAYLRGVRKHAEGSTPRNVAIIAKRLGFDAEFLRTACFATVYSDAHVDAIWMNEFQRWAVEKGYAPSVIPAADAIDGSFAKAAALRLDARGSR